MEKVEDAVKTVLGGINQGEFGVFCGAGISYNSGVPLVAQFERVFLEELGANKIDVDKFLNSTLPFEAFMRRIEKHHEILDVYANAKPTLAHYVLASLMVIGKVKTIVTTNFDTLIEQALLASGWNSDTHYHLFYREDDLSSITWGVDSKPTLIKIHGSIVDKESIIATLNRVASRQLSINQKQVIDNMFSKGLHKSVLILGYSSSDVFDINPQIEAITSQKKDIYFISHSESDGIEAIQNQVEKNPFQNYQNGWRVFYDTDTLLERMQKEILRDNKIPKERKSTPWKNIIMNWSKNQPQARKLSIIGSILMDIAEYDRAKIYHQEAFSLVEGTNDEGAALLNLAGYYYSTGEYQTAIELYQESIEKISNASQKIDALSALGSSYQFIGKFKDALSIHKAALDLAELIGSEDDQASAYSNIGATYQYMSSFNLAIQYFEKALEIAKNRFTLEKAGTILNNLCNSYGGIGDYQRAISCSMEALQIAKKTGDRSLEALSLGNIGNMHHAQRNHNEAIDFGNKALDIHRAIGNKNGEAGCLNNLGAAYGDLKQYAKAIECYQLCLQLVKQTNNQLMEGYVLNNLGTNHFILGNFSEAAAYHKNAVDVFLQLLPENHPLIGQVRRYYQAAIDASRK